MALGDGSTPTADILTIVGIIVGVFTASLTSVWSLSWWLQGQFSAVKKLLFDQIAKTEINIMSKLEYHEKHDDQRFTSIDQRFAGLKDDLWEIRLRNATLDNNILKAHRGITDKET